MVGITAARSLLCLWPAFLWEVAWDLSQGECGWMDTGKGVGAGEWNEWAGVKAPVPLCSICLDNCPRLWASNARWLPIRKAVVFLCSPCVGKAKWEYKGKRRHWFISSTYCPCEGPFRLWMHRSHFEQVVFYEVGEGNILKTLRFLCTYRVHRGMIYGTFWEWEGCSRG